MSAQFTSSDADAVRRFVEDVCWVYHKDYFVQAEPSGEELMVAISPKAPSTRAGMRTEWELILDDVVQKVREQFGLESSVSKQKTGERFGLPFAEFSFYPIHGGTIFR